VEGYTLSNGACNPSGGSRQTQSPPQQPLQQTSQSVQSTSIPTYSNCLNVGANGCTNCIQGFTIVNGYCQPLPQFCQTADQTGNCISCMQGYNVTIDGVCISSGSVANCRVVTGNGCRECSTGYWLNGTTCQVVNTQCSTFNSTNGFCTSCYNGYSLNQTNGQCVQSLNTNKNCQQFGPDGNCLKCFASSFLNPSKVCTLQNNLCATINQNTGECISCYQGYILANGNCTIRASDPSCKSFNSDNTCQECSTSFYLSMGKCVRFNPLCATINPTTGDCTSCYNGYTLKQGNCSIGTSVTVANCRTIQNGICVACSTGYFRASNNTCQQISPLCATADQQTGLCLTCYNGYQLRNGVCLLSQSIANCRQISNNVCLACSTGYFLQNGGCVQISSLCATADNTTGYCLSCYQGYILSSGSCVISQNSNCRQLRNNVCVDCAQGYMMTNGNCVVINPLCRTV
jgi:proprotein convertase subtilisin/kexin type 5